MSDDDPTAGPAPDGAAEAPARSDLWSTLDVDPGELVPTLRALALGLAAGLVAAAVSLLLLLVASGEGAWPPFHVWLTGPVQLVAMALGGSISGDFGSGDPDFDFSGSISYRFVPLSVLVPVLLVVHRVVLRSAPRVAGSGRRDLWTAALAAAAASAVVFVVALVAPVDLSEGGDSFTMSAADVGQVVGGVVLLGASVLVARRQAAGRRVLGRLPVGVADAVRAAVVHAVVFTVVATVYVAVLLLVEGEPLGLVALPVAMLNGAPSAAALAHLGAIDIGGAGMFLGESGGGGATFWIFSEGGIWQLYVTPVLALVALLAAACTLHLRGASRPRTPADWGWAAVAFGALGAVCSVVGHASAGGGGGGFGGGSIGFGPAAWFFLVLAVWGLAAEGLRRTIAPALVELLPSGVADRLRGPRPPADEPRSETAEGAATSAAPLPAAPALTPEQRRRQRRFLVLGGVAVAVVVAGFVAVSVIGRTVFSPKDAVTEYLDGLGGTPAEVRAAIESTRDEELLGDPEVTAALFAAARDGDLEHEVRDVDVMGDYATVTVAVDGAGTDAVQTFALERSGSRYGVFPRWRIVDAPSGSLTIRAPGAESIRAGDLTVELAGLDDGADVAVLPAEYAIAAPGASRFEEYSSETLQVGEDEYTSIDLDVVATQALTDEVAKQADAYLDACISQKRLDPDNCPNEAFGFDVSKVRWTLDERPTYTVESDYDGAWRMSVETPGTASVTGEEAGVFDGDPVTEFEDSVQISFVGDVRIDGDSVTVDFAPF